MRRCAEASDSCGPITCTVLLMTSLSCIGTPTKVFARAVPRRGVVKRIRPLIPAPIHTSARCPRSLPGIRQRQLGTAVEDDGCGLHACRIGSGTQVAHYPCNDPPAATRD